MNENFIRAIIDIIVGLGVILLGFPFLLSRYKAGKTDAQEESNHILRALVEDQKKSIESLQTRQIESEKKIAHLEGQLSQLTKKKTDLEEIITHALVEYFEHHPDVAAKIHKKTSQNV